ncbi:MAG: phosphatase PAP2 family protein [Lachnospiraceae bacterium]|nr:phosphatase PAP2 family protein [Lachnospiraceae bacterium]
MKNKEKWLLTAFVFWTYLVLIVDVQQAGETGTEVGFATINTWFHEWTGVSLQLYTITDWLGLVPVGICLIFGMIGLLQLIKRKGLRNVDADLILLGIYYVVVIFGYLIFEMIPINYRPIFIEGRMEASYPSSTTLLVLSVMPTLVFQVNRRVGNQNVRKIFKVMTMMFSIFMVGGRLFSGVHWLTDIIGSVLLSAGLFYSYEKAVRHYDKKE